MQEAPANATMPSVTGRGRTVDPNLAKFVEVVRKGKIVYCGGDETLSGDERKKSANSEKTALYNACKKAGFTIRAIWDGNEQRFACQIKAPVSMAKAS